MKKLLTGILTFCLIASTGALAACGGNNNDDNNDPPGIKTAVFEAEGVDLSEQSGHGWSNNAAGCQMIQGTNTAKIKENKSVLDSISNGYFVGFFGTAGTELVFDVNAEAAAADSTLILRLGSEWGTLTIDSSVLKIEVNGENMDYTPFTVTGKSVSTGTEIEYGVPFKDFTVGKINLKQGANTIKIIAQGKTVSGKDGFNDIGPGVDCIKIKSETNVTWESLWEDNKLNVKNDQ